MKTKRNLSDYTIEELKSKKNVCLSVLISFGTLLFFATIFLAYSAIRTENYAFLAIGSGSFIFIIPLFIQLSQLSKEIQSREN